MRLTPMAWAGLFVAFIPIGCGSEIGDDPTATRTAGLAPVASSALGTQADALRSRLETFGVAADVRERLLAKFLAGQPLDSDTAATPVSSETTVEGGFVRTRHVYADGSVAIGAEEQPEEAAPGTVRPLSITGCNSRVDSHGTHIYSNCKIAWDAATWSVSWTADFDYNVNGEAITSAKSVHFGGVGDFSGAGTEIVTLRADNQGTAIADGYVNQKIGLGPTSITRRVGVRLRVATRWSGRKARESPFST